MLLSGGSERWWRKQVQAFVTGSQGNVAADVITHFHTSAHHTNKGRRDPFAAAAMTRLAIYQYCIETTSLLLFPIWRTVTLSSQF